MILALLLVVLLGEVYRRTRRRVRALLPLLPPAWRALRAQLGDSARGIARWEWWGIAAITLLALLVRVMYLGQPMRYDESATWLDYASRPIAQGLSDYRFPNNHLLHTLLVHVSASLFGDAPWALRLPAFLAGVVLVPLTWALARTLHTRMSACGAAGLAAVSTTLVLYSTNARGYSILCCLTVALALLATRVLRADNPATWTAMAAIAALGVWTIPIMLYPAGAIGTWLWLEARAGDASIDAGAMRSRLGWTGLGALCLTALLYLPVVARTGLALVVGNRFVRPQSRGEFFAQLPAFLSDVARDFARGWPAWLAVLVGAGIVVELTRRRRRHRVPLLVAMVGWSVLLLVVNGRIPYVRVWMFLLPVVLGTAAAGIERAIGLTLVRRSPRVRMTVAVVALAAITFLAGVGMVQRHAVERANDTGTLRDGAAIAALLADSAGARDHVVASAPADLPLAYHLTRRVGTANLLRATPDSSQRLWIVASDIDQQREDSLVHMAEIVTADFSAPRLVRRFSDSRVYVRLRTRAGCALDPAACR